MKKPRLFFSFFLLICVNAFGQNDSITAMKLDKTQDSSRNTLRDFDDHTAEEGEGPVYKLKPSVDVPLTVVAAGWTTFAFTKIYSKESSTMQQIENLRISDINGFDRWAADIHSEKAADASDLIFYGSMPLPALLFLDKDIRKDAGKIGFLYLQAMSVTGLLYTSATYLTDRYRPYAYNPSVPMGDRLEGGAKNSFFAGHVALVGTSTFFIAKVYSDYHPGSKLNVYLYSAAALATGATGYLRHRGGRHFPTDVLLGTAVGTLSGILVPHLHKNKAFKNRGLSITPFTGRAHGLSVVYRL